MFEDVKERQFDDRPVCKLSGEDGNIFNLIAVAKRALRDAGQRERGEEMQTRVMTEAQSYDHALRMIMEYVEVE